MSNSLNFTPTGRISRTAMAVLAVGIAVMVALLLSWHSAPATAETYPPTVPSSSVPASSSSAPSGFGLEPTAVSRPAGDSASTSVASTNNHRSEGLSSTGFQTLAATTIALALIGGGAIFLGLGRRRRHG